MTQMYLLAALAFHWIPQISNSTASLRGLSVASKNVVWASGSKGMVLRTLDGGKDWVIRKVPGAEALDFRDVVAFDARNALVMASGTGDAARVYLTSDGGEQWTLVLRNPDSTGFFDAMKFWNRQQGMLLGDPVAGHFTIFTTENGGLNWIKVKQPAALEGEGAFAASGTSLTLHGRGEAWFGTGGPNVARVFHTADKGQSWTVATTPIAGNTAASGIFSVLFTDGRHGVVVGGDYQKPGDPGHTVALSADGGQTWTLPDAGIGGGFRSAATFLKDMKMLIATGTSGSDYSLDGGRTWHSISNESVNAVASYRNQAWAVGAKGLILKLTPRLMKLCALPALLLPALLSLSCARPALKVDASKRTLLANGYDASVLKIYGVVGPPGIEILGDPTRLRVIRPHQEKTYWASDLEAGVLPGVAQVVVTSGEQHQTMSVTLQPETTDSAADGTPDFMRLDDESDRSAFRGWLTYLSEIQYFIAAKQRSSEIKDCSALIRYAYREAMRNHSAAWLAGAGLPVIQARASIQKYSFPHTPLRANLFRTRSGTYSPLDLSNGTFAEFADARTLRQFNMYFISRDVARAQPGDVLFYRRETSKGASYHSMIFVGSSTVNMDGGIYVVYHTGPEGADKGEIHRLSMNQLLHFPDPEWQAISANPFFLGVYRWNILKPLS